MKKVSMLLMAVAMVLGFTVTSHAVLINNLDGTITQVRNDATYGDGKTVMWLQDTTLSGQVNWHDAISWVDSLNASNYLGYSDWELPSNYVWDTTGEPTISPCTVCFRSDYGYMHYIELENPKPITELALLTGISHPDGVVNSGPFINLNNDNYYWTQNTWSVDIQAWACRSGSCNDQSKVTTQNFY
ncbi:MAG: DUF1566 domain-containing protein, partial [Proteobacteria bacterium]|nr:DUF1566 domain-containing protein [Pseudomonadota bacterium]